MCWGRTGGSFGSHRSVTVPCQQVSTGAWNFFWARRIDSECLLSELIFINPELLCVLCGFLMWKVEFCVELMWKAELKDSHWPHGDTRPAVPCHCDNSKINLCAFYSLILNPNAFLYLSCPCPMCSNDSKSFHPIAWAWYCTRSARPHSVLPFWTWFRPSLLVSSLSLAIMYYFIPLWVMDHGLNNFCAAEECISLFSGEKEFA